MSHLGKQAHPLSLFTVITTCPRCSLALCLMLPTPQIHVLSIFYITQNRGFTNFHQAPEHMQPHWPDPKPQPPPRTKHALFDSHHTAQLCLFQSSGARCLNQHLFLPDTTQISSARSSCQELACLLLLLFLLNWCPPRQFLWVGTRLLSTCLRLWPSQPTHAPQASCDTTF